MSIDLILNQVAFKLGSEIADPEIVCRIDDYRIRTDRHGRKTLVLELRCAKHGRVVVALSPSYAKEFGERIKKLGIERISDLYSYCYIFEKVQLPKVREDYTNPHPRYLPREIVQCPEELVQT